MKTKLRTAAAILSESLTVCQLSEVKFKKDPLYDNEVKKVLFVCGQKALGAKSFKQLARVLTEVRNVVPKSLHKLPRSTRLHLGRVCQMITYLDDQGLEALRQEAWEKWRL